MGFLLDTNLYVAANRNRVQAESLAAFYKKHLGKTHLHAVVAEEILAGARNREDARATHGFFIQPFEHSKRIVVPTYDTWKRVGEIIWRLASEGFIHRATLPRSFTHDVMLAASCRERGYTLVTANVADFELIRKVERFEFVRPFPK